MISHVTWKIKSKSTKVKLNCHTSEYILFPISHVSFCELLTKQTPFNINNKIHCDIITLGVDVGSKAMVGPPGSFKTCHPATLHLKQSQNPLSTKLTAILQLHNIVAKHLYFHDPPGMNTSVSLLTPSKKQKHLAIKDELIEMLDEANCLYLAGSLMDLLYDWTDKLVAVKKSCSPVIKIPQLCFVHSALAIPQNVQDSQAAVYLLEEKINRKFVKYINNNSASPRDGLLPSQFNIALFLCFAQYCSLPLLRSILLSSSASLNIALFLCFAQYCSLPLLHSIRSIQAHARLGVPVWFLR
ncbi:hypothetical protein SERLA73DRAFT_127553 [Serpula lacrymans var. lacrymans S7.3]|uniref:Uncharacterized protein n=1 Tax=Serpula lacrymans var. lacrymans (strain S7.3) TaxID=936435 RepID=F8QH26_SERL3|nr:hypothetical protein SERLA73DRAFT_127553 [Serpula lacrymans var. lacrymans S7.3]